LKENFINKTFCLNTIILWSNTIVDHFHFTKDIFASKISSYILNGSMISSCKRRIGRNSEGGDEETKTIFVDLRLQIVENTATAREKDVPCSTPPFP